MCDVNARRVQRKITIARFRSTIAATTFLMLLPTHLCLAQQSADAGFGRGASYTVSVRELKLRIPKSAVKEFTVAWKALEKGDYESAAEHFQKSIAVHQDFYHAVNNLGVAYFRMNRIDLAAKHFSNAVAVGGHSPYIYRNLAVACLQLREYAEGERAARGALDVEPSEKFSLLLLGASLLLQQKFTFEAKNSLQRAATEFPQANLWLSAAYFDSGELNTARSHLEAYVRAGDKDKGRLEKAAALMKRLDVPVQALNQLPEQE